jgi:hypothetical protein
MPPRSKVLASNGAVVYELSSDNHVVVTGDDKQRRMRSAVKLSSHLEATALIQVADRRAHRPGQVAPATCVIDAGTLEVEIGHVLQVGGGDLVGRQPGVLCGERADRVLVEKGRVLPAVITTRSVTR